MSRRHRLRSGRRYEELLDDLRSDDSDLSALLEVARAPGARDEMGGLRAATSAFMSVPYVRTRPAATVSRLPAATRAAAGRLLALKFIAAVSGVTLVGGAAYAATGARLPGGSSPHKHSTSSSGAPSPNTGEGGGDQYLPPGQVRPTPAGPVPAVNTRGADGNNSAARSEHPPANPANPPRHSNAPGPDTTHTPQPHQTPAPHNTQPHPSPSTHNSSSARSRIPADRDPVTALPN